MTQSVATRLTFRLATLGLLIATPLACDKSDAPPDGNAAKTENANLRNGEKKADLSPSLSPIRFRLATYNINFGNPNLPAVIDAIKTADADIVCLQETNSKSAAALKQAFRRSYRYSRFNGSVRPYYAGGFGILSKLPIVNERFIPPRFGLFGTQVIEVQIAGRHIHIFNLHLRPLSLPRDKGAHVLTAALPAHNEAEQTRLREIELLLQHVSPQNPTLIAGDFNSFSYGKAPTTLTKQGFIDSFASANEKPGNHATWHWRTKFGTIAFRIDYIFHSASIRTTSSRIVRSAGSDHYLTVSTLEMVNRGE